MIAVSNVCSRSLESAACDCSRLLACLAAPRSVHTGRRCIDAPLPHQALRLVSPPRCRVPPCANRPSRHQCDDLTQLFRDIIIHGGFPVRPLIRLATTSLAEPRGRPYSNSRKILCVDPPGATVARSPIWRAPVAQMGMPCIHGAQVDAAKRELVFAIERA
jgi:hypothetical protein